MMKKILILIIIVIVTACSVMIVTKPKGDVNNGGTPFLESDSDIEFGLNKKDSIN